MNGKDRKTLRNGGEDRKMIIVQMSGGLGNQMFEYALYLKLRSMGKEVRMDDATCYGPGQRTKQLDVFGVSYDAATPEQLCRMTDSSMDPLSRVRRKLTGRRDLSYREAGCDYDPLVFQKDPALLQGCFQSERYFSDIRDRVREAYRFRNLRPEGRILEYRDKILEKKGSSVAVHLRRGDYLDPKFSALYQGICTDGWYEEAIRLMRQRVPDAAFFFFSNDPRWVKEHYRGAGYVTVDGGTEDAGYEDLYLMSLCSHQIIANSSFSWWGAWLNDNPDKTVIAPKRWINGRSCRDIYTKEMTLL